MQNKVGGPLANLARRYADLRAFSNARKLR